MSTKRMLLINGSARRKGTSNSFAVTLARLARERCWEADVSHVMEFQGSGDKARGLLDAFASYDTVGIVAPIYYDDLPSPVIGLMEALYANKGGFREPRSLFAISQGAFPDPDLSRPSIGTCRCFAEAMGWTWLGGAGYGGGVLIDGVPLERLGGKGKRITSGLALVMDSVNAGKPITPEARELLRVRVPKWTYPALAWVMNMRNRMIARQMGVRDLERKVYAD